MTTASQALGSIFGVISTTADSVSSVANTANSGINMLNKHVNQLSWEQDKRITARQDTFVQNLAEQSVLEAELRRQKIDEFVKANPQSEARMQKHLTDLLAKLNA